MRRNNKALARRSRRHAKALSRRRSGVGRRRAQALAESRRSPPPHPLEEAPARAAWAKHVVDHPLGCPPLWPALVSRFAETLPERHREASMVVILIALSSAHGERQLLGGEWISFATTECYLHFEGSGFREARVLRTVEQFIDWLFGQWRFDPWVHQGLLRQLDDARESHGLARRHPTAVDTVFWVQDLEPLAERFVEAIGPELHPISRSMAPSGLRLLHWFAAAHQGRADQPWASFGSIDVDATLAEALTFREPEDGLEQGIPDSTETFLEIGGRFYRWLADEGYLDVQRANEIAGRFHAQRYVLPRLTPAA